MVVPDRDAASTGGTENPMPLRPCYGMPGTDVAYRATRKRLQPIKDSQSLHGYPPTHGLRDARAVGGGAVCGHVRAQHRLPLLPPPLPPTAPLPARLSCQSGTIASLSATPALRTPPLVRAERLRYLPTPALRNPWY
eukprot:895423-Rhodomonas_salina.6